MVKDLVVDKFQSENVGVASSSLSVEWSLSVGEVDILHLQLLSLIEG